jgi:hypothetical protein
MRPALSDFLILIQSRNRPDRSEARGVMIAMARQSKVRFARQSR